MTLTLLLCALRLASPFTDGAVLQRGMNVPVWGEADPGCRISVEFAGQKLTTKTDASGKWRVDLAPMAASKESRSLVVSMATSESVQTVQTVRDVLVGEVWVCSGQSNMCVPFWGQSPRSRERLGGALSQIVDRPLIRTANLFGGWWKDPQKTESVVWKKMDRDFLTGGKASAVACWYAMTLYDALDVPIGILRGAAGGSGIDPWTPRSVYAKYPGLRDIADYPVKPDDESWYRLKLVRGPINGPNQQPCVYWNGTFAPIVPYAVKGVVWYQGENNSHGDEPKRYCEKMHALYDGYASEFENPNLSFYFAQLAPWGLKTVQDIQEAQAKFAQEEPHAGMAVLCDVGNLHDIHPNDKQTVAVRLALLALKRDYGRDIVADSPTLKGWKIEDNRFVLSFDNVRSWFLYDPDWVYQTDPARTETLGFEVSGPDGVWHPARIGNLTQRPKVSYVEFDGSIEGRDLVVWSDKVQLPRRLRYLHRQPWRGSLYNEAGLPLGVFHVGY